MPQVFKFQPDGTIAHYEREFRDLQPGEWVLQNNRNPEWHLSHFPITLIIAHNPKEALPFLGSIQAPSQRLTLREFHAWPTLEQAAVGVFDWGLAELSKAYHELAKFRAGGT